VKSLIDYIYSKLVKFVGIFYKLSHKLPLDCLKMLYFSFVHPHILYGVEIFANTYTLYLDKLLKLNNKLLRILQQKDNYCRNIELYVNYNILPITELHCFQILCIVHKLTYHKELLPKIYHNYFTENYKIHDYYTRNKNNLHLSTVNLCFGSRAITFKRCNLWNQLSEDIKQVQNITTFKNK